MDETAPTADSGLAGAAAAPVDIGNTILSTPCCARICPAFFLLNSMIADVEAYIAQDRHGDQTDG